MLSQEIKWAQRLSADTGECAKGNYGCDEEGAGQWRDEVRLSEKSLGRSDITLKSEEEKDPLILDTEEGIIRKNKQHPQTYDIQET